MRRFLAIGMWCLWAFAAMGSVVTRLVLVDAQSDRDIRPLEEGATIDLDAERGGVSLRAEVSGDVGSVRFLVDARVVQTESTPPYAIAGDQTGDYAVWSVQPGRHRVRAVPYAGSGGGGTAGEPLEIGITVVGAAVSEGAGASRAGVVALEAVPAAVTMEPGTIELSGELKKWHTVTLAMGGPASSETSEPNPFLDLCLRVVFRNGDRVRVVPGYYAADGNAAESGAAAGNVWMAHFCPEAEGDWSWTVSFRQGAQVAVADDPAAGAPVVGLDGLSGTFSIGPTDKAGRDHRGKGMLRYVGQRYLQFAETGEWFLKCGADAPENFLAYADFDNTPDHGGRRKSWAAHAADWRAGDPTWRGGRGKGMIGALNYLTAEGLNAFSFIPMNLFGDDGNVFPYVTERGPYDRFDCSKLAQWEVVFRHADRLGLYLHFKTQETENELLLDNGDLGKDRRMYYRELIARFSHHLALNWNLGEEIDNATTAQKKSWARYFHETDPYQHHIVIHNGANHYDLLGPESALTGFSLQTDRTDFGNVHRQTLNYIRRSTAAGKTWVVACDEPGDATHALRPDADAGDSHEDGRKNGLWGNVMAGGAGLEWYFGYAHAHSDLTCEDFRSRDRWWDYCRYMLAFFDENAVPFWAMESHDELTSVEADYCFAKPGEVYVVYLKSGGPVALDLRGVEGLFEVMWYDPRNGGPLQAGTVREIAGGGMRDLGSAPGAQDADWVILVR